MKKILLSILTIALVSGAVYGATQAQFSDTETSTGNTFTAGTLDLSVDSENPYASVKFTVNNAHVGMQRIGTWRLKNEGTVNGLIDLKNISVTGNENGCNEPETVAGDLTCTNPGAGEGELQNVIKLSKLFWDNDCDGWVGTGEPSVYDGAVGAIAANYDTNRSLNAGATQCLTGQFNWWATADDNKAQGDSFTFDMTFELAE